MYHLIKGDPMEPSDTDLIGVVTTIRTDQSVPDGCRVTTGNSSFSEIVGIFYRYEIEERDL